MTTSATAPTNRSAPAPAAGRHRRTVGLFALRFLLDYARRPLNLVLLAAVPLVFVTLSAGVLADFADILGDGGTVGEIEAATAGWAAAALAGTAGFFHVTSSRTADRRLAAAGALAWRVVAARLASGMVLALIAAAGALLALALRTDIVGDARVIGATLLMALIYLGIGAVVGALARSELNGSLIVLFAWMVDVFLGPGMGRGETSVTYVFPLHFPTLIVTDVASGHAGPFGDIGLALLWTAGALTLGVTALVLTTRPRRRRTRAHGRVRRLGVALRYAVRDYRRNTVLWVLLVLLPAYFITLSILITPDTPAPVELTENGIAATRILGMAELHGAVMVPITVGFLAGLAGVFVALSSSDGDARLIIAGYRPMEVLCARAGVVTLAATLTTIVALAVTSVSFTPDNWPVFAGSTLVIALTYGFAGALLGPWLGQLGGMYVMLALPFLDLGVAQNAMFDAVPPAWGTVLPGHGAMRVLLDGAFTPDIDEWSALALAIGWLVAIAAVSAAVFHHRNAVARPAGRRRVTPDGPGAAAAGVEAGG